MNNTVRLNAGEKILVEIPGDEYRSYWEFTYDELVDILSKRPKSHASRRSRSPENLASRRVSLLTRSIITGQWATGALIDRNEKARKLASILEETGYMALSAKAQDGICRMLSHIQQTPALRPLLDIVRPYLPGEELANT